ncbi:unnamed protein product [Haemonchus placei]|uniref:Uncharacterized protein n=1 Tax=Haemonchus placei TaxID=6290 RepID=A0A0N4WE75_HAEPC|nr:unnamed protein product [Haemonchus placei]
MVTNIFDCGIVNTSLLDPDHRMDRMQMIIRENSSNDAIHPHRPPSFRVRLDRELYKIRSNLFPYHPHPRDTQKAYNSNRLFIDMTADGSKIMTLRE